MKRLAMAVGTVVVVGCALAAFAQDRTGSSVVGWRGDGSGVFPNTTPPLRWSRTAKNSIVTRLLCSAAKPKGDATEGAVPCPDGIPRSWMVLGPFDGAEIDKSPVDDESTLAPDARIGDVEWQPFAIPDELDFQKTHAATGNSEMQRFVKVPARGSRTAYVHTWLHSPRDGTITADLGHEGPLRIWLNGKEVFRTDKPYFPQYPSQWFVTVQHDHRRFVRGDGPPERYAALELRKGWNRLLVKVAKTPSVRMVLLDGRDVEYETENILWVCPMPDWGAGSCIVVGDRVFATAEPDILVCVDRGTGKILWQRTNGYYEATPQAQKDANPIFREKITPLYEQFIKTTDENGRIGLRHQIEVLLKGIDAARYPGHDVKSITNTGYTFPTPASDGRHVYFLSTAGVAACYDLDGNRKWINLIAHYGSFATRRTEVHQSWNIGSPLIVGDKLIIQRSGLLALDRETGKDLWFVSRLHGEAAKPGEGHREPYYDEFFNGGPVLGKIGDTEVVWAGRGSLVRVSDGKLLWSFPIAPTNSCAVCPVFVDGKFFQAETEGPLVTIEPPPQCSDAPDVKMVPHRNCLLTWGYRKPPVPNYYPSLLHHDGLLYAPDLFGRLAVVDAKTFRRVYETKLDLEPYSVFFTAGATASPALAGGKYVFVTDNQGSTVVFETGREFKPVAKNTIQHFVRRRYCHPQQESLEGNLFFDGPNIFIRAEENLYCIGEK